MPNIKTSDPFISIIITAHKRKEYLLDAFKSAYNQTLSKNKYEIIVTKNFVDDELDSFIKNHLGKLILFKKIGLGPRIADVLKYAKGEVICFLEDDDLFEKEKLEFVYKLFKENKDLGYVNNARNYIDERGNKLITGLNKFEKFENNILIRQRNLLELLRLDILGLNFNNSSISIRKSILSKYLSLLKGIPYSVDLCLYILALDSDLALMLIDKKLTKYRIHTSTSVHLTSYNDFKKTLLETGNEELTLLKKLYRKFKRPEIKKYLEIRIRERTIDYLFYKCNCKKKVLLNYVKNLPYLVVVRPKIYLLKGFQVIFYIISPKKFRRFNYRRTKNYTSSLARS